MRRGLVLLLVLVLGLGLALLGTARAESPSDAFGADQRALCERLRVEDVGALARALEGTPLPSGFRELALRIDVLVRAGHLAALEPALRALSAQPRDLQRSLGADLVDRLARPLTYRAALRACELAPEAAPHGPSRLLDLWREAEPGADVLAWVEARARDVPEVWTPLLLTELWRRWDAGDRAPLRVWRAATETRLALAPDDEPLARAYLQLAAGPGRRLGELLAWAPWRYDLLRPSLAATCADLADSAPPPARLLLLERARALPFTDADQQRLRRMWSVPVVGFDVPRAFRRGVARELVRLHQQAGNLARAQALIEDLTAGGAADVLDPSLAELSGGVQAASGARVVEQRLRSAPADDARTWHARALYYVGRREPAEADAAFAHALARADDTTEPARHRILDDQVRWLLNSGRAEEAWATARRGFAAAVPGSWAAMSLAHWLVHPGAPPLAADAPDVWRHLEAVEDWRFSGTLDLLARLLPAAFARAEQAARAGPPARLLALGSLALGRGDLARSLPLLEEAARRLEDRPGHADRTAARRALFQALLRAGRWREAEALLEPAWLWGGAWPLVEVALAATAQGARADALRLWAQAWNQDRGAEQGLEALRAAGLGTDLLRFHEQQAAADPASEVAALLVQRLRR